MKHTKTTLQTPPISKLRLLLERPVELDLTATPYDLTTLAQAVVEKILIAKDLHPRSPLIAPMGENHFMPVTNLAQSAVMATCIKEGLVPSLGHETPCTILNDVIDDILIESDTPNDQIDDLLAYLLQQAKIEDPDNTMLTAFLADDNASTASREVFRFCADHGIKVSYNDAARDDFDDVDFIDDQHPETGKFLKQFGYDIYDTTISNDKGLHLRNAFMVAQSIEKWQSSSADILVHTLGLAHVYGDRQTFKAPYNQSFNAIARAKGIQTIPVTFATNGDIKTPLNTDKSSRIHIRGWQNLTEYEEATDEQTKEASNNICEIYAKNAELFGYKAVQTDHEQSQKSQPLLTWIDQKRAQFMRLNR